MHRFTFFHLASSYVFYPALALYPTASYHSPSPSVPSGASPALATPLAHEHMAWGTVTPTSPPSPFNHPIVLLGSLPEGNVHIRKLWRLS